MQQTYSQDQFYRVVRHPCLEFPNERPQHWPGLHQSHVMRTTGKAWVCEKCRAVLTPAGTLKPALQQPCKVQGKQTSISFNPRCDPEPARPSKKRAEAGSAVLSSSEQAATCAPPLLPAPKEKPAKAQPKAKPNVKAKSGKANDPKQYYTEVLIAAF